MFQRIDPSMGWWTRRFSGFAAAACSLLAVLLLSACAVRKATPPPASPEPFLHELNPDAVGGVSDPGLRQLLHDHWEATLLRWPAWASALGDRRYDDALADTRPDAYIADRERLAGFLEQQGLSPVGSQ